MEKEKTQEQRPNNNGGFPFRKENYQIMVGGLLLLFVGFIVMSLDSKENHGFGFIGLTLGPIIVFAGFMTGIAAILYKKK